MINKENRKNYSKYTNKYIIKYLVNVPFFWHFNANLALVGQLYKTLDRASLGGLTTSTFPIHTCRS